MRSSWKRRLSVVACAVAIAATGWAPAALAAPAPDPNRARIDTVIHDSAQQTTLIVYSAAMRRLVPVNVLRPNNRTKPRPTLYLLNGGAGGGEDSATWAAKTQYVKFFRDKQVNVVTPIGGAFSYYTDWQRDDPVLGRNKWTTFLTRELPPVGGQGIQHHAEERDRRHLDGRYIGAEPRHRRAQALQVGRRLQRLRPHQ